MPRKYLLQRFETCSETWSWSTDILTTVSNSEQRIALRDYPAESVEFNYRFGDDGSTNDGLTLVNGQDATIRNLNDLIVARDEIIVPMWQYADHVATASFSDSLTVSISVPSASKSPFYSAQYETALLLTSAGWYIVSVSSWNPSTGSGTFKFGTPPGISPATFLEIVPLRLGTITDEGKVSIFRYGEGSDCSLKAKLYRPPQGARQLTIQGEGLNPGSYLSLPIFDLRGESNVSLTIKHGTEFQETESNFPYYVSRWTEPQFELSLTHKFNRYNSTTLGKLRGFLGFIRGAQGLFWLPTRHDDFEVLATVGTTAATLRGRQYYDLWWNSNCKALCLDTGLDAIKVMQITDVDLNEAGNTEILFHTSTGWTNPIRQVSLAFPVRLKSDDVKFEHFARHSKVAFSCVSVQIAWTPSAYGDPVLDLDFSNPLATIVSNEFDALPNSGTLGGTFTAASTTQRPNVNYWRGKKSALTRGDSSPWEAMLAPNLTDYAFLTKLEAYCVSVRFEIPAVSVGIRYILSGVSAPYLRLYADLDGSITVRNPNTLTSAAGVLVSGGRYTAQIVKAVSGLTTVYVDGVQVSSANTSYNNAAWTTPLEIGSSNSRGGIKLGRVLIHRGNLSATKREQIRAQLEADWPDTDPLLLSVDGSDENATFDATGLGYETIPATGETTGVFASSRQLNPQQAAANGLPGPRFASGAFNPLTLPSSPGAVPFLWAEADQSATYSGAVMLTDVPALPITISGRASKEFPIIRVKITQGGARGYAKFAISTDGGLTYRPEQYTAETVTFGPYAITFPFGDYVTGQYAEPYATGMADLSSEGNDLVPYGTGLRVAPTQINGRAAWLATDPAVPTYTRFFQRATLNNSRNITGGNRMTVIIVGDFGPTPSDAILMGGDFGARCCYVNASNIPSIASSAHGTGPSSVTANKPFVFVGRWNGASSQLTIKQLGLADISATVNPVDPASVSLDAISWGGIVSTLSYLCEGYKFGAIYAVDETAGAISNADMGYLVDGFCSSYGLSASFAADLLQAVLDNGNSELTYLHNNTRNFAVCFAMRVDNVPSSTFTVFESVNAAGNAGFRTTFNTSTNQLSVSMIGASTTTKSLTLPTNLSSNAFIIELRFTFGASSNVAVWVNGLLSGTLSFSTHTYSSATQDTAPIIGASGRGFAVFELLIRSDFTSQADYLRKKWFPYLWVNLLTNLSDDAITNTDSDLIGA